MEEEERKTHRGRDVRLLTYGASSERKALGTLLYSTLFPGFNDDIEAVSYKNSSQLITNDDSAPPPAPPLNHLHTDSAIFTPNQSIVYSLWAPADVSL